MRKIKYFWLKVFIYSNFLDKGTTDRVKSAIGNGKKLKVESRPSTSKVLLKRPTTGIDNNKSSTKVEKAFSKHYRTEGAEEDDFFVAKSVKFKYHEKDNSKPKTKMAIAKNTYSFSNLMLGKNQDKIIMNQNPSIFTNRLTTEQSKFLDQSLHHTNNLFMYRQKVNIDNNNNNSNKNIYKMKIHALEAQFKKFNKVSKDSGLDFSNKCESQHEKLTNNIDSLIKSIEKTQLNTTTSL